MNRTKVVIGIILAFISFALLFLVLSQNGSVIDMSNSKVEPKVLGEPNPISAEVTDMDYNGSKIRIAKVQADPSLLQLLPNHDKKATSVGLMQENACRGLVNAGFYDVDGSPIGLLISNSEMLSVYVKNSLLDGILSVNEFDTPRIGYAIPKDKLVTAVQSGPILKQNNSYQTISLKRDKMARRIVAAVNGSNELFFLAIYNQASVFDGPLLEDLPKVLVQYEKESGDSIADAINLDGGKASAFITQNVKLTEISPVGSYFCVK